jgi:hypothetical protein
LLAVLGKQTLKLQKLGIADDDSSEEEEEGEEIENDGNSS